MTFPQLRTNPVMNPKAVIQGDRWRIGVLTESLIRLEWQDDGCFEDRATQMVVDRNWLGGGEGADGMEPDGAAPHFTQTVRDGLLIVDTPALRLTYDMQPFSKEGLSIVVKGVANSQMNTWHYGDAQRGNLRGTARTLDEVNGETELGLGVVSRDGWAVLDDSASNVIVEGAEAVEVKGEANPFGTWVVPRDNDGIDLYFFGYGHRYIEAVRDFYRLTGPTPLLPRFALGNWWSRYHRYTETEYMELVDRFEKEGLPFTTAVIDMDWHLVDDVDPKYGSGWTGYTWNRAFFPDPERFQRTLHEHGLRTTLNVHPRDGIRAYEDGYTDVARHMGIDPASGDPVEFDLTSPRFMDAYFRLHHRLEDMGTDFWWLDWQQGGVTRQKGLDPLWMLNHMHYLDSGRDGRWPLTFSRYAGPGSHRYPVGFSGDTVVTWESLKFQPYFTATASNIGYGWWSHDIGGHMFGYRDEELEARWYQLGTFSPINRLHSTDSSFNGKEPWNFHPETEAAMDTALRLRHELIPYLYSMNWRAAVEGRPLVEPMYWQAPENHTAYDVEQEFRFGTELVVAPIVAPADCSVQMAKADVWLPQGTWFDFLTGRRYESRPADGRKFEVWRGLDGIPVFAKAGGIVPLQRLDESNGPINAVGNPRHLEVTVFPGASGAFELKEDDGTNQARPDESALAVTSLTLQWGGGEAVAGGASEQSSGSSDVEDTTVQSAEIPDLVLRGAADRSGAANCAKTRFIIAPVAGNAAAVPERRTWTVTFRGVASSAALSASVGGEPVEVQTAYDAESLSLSLTVADVPVEAEVVIDADGLRIADDPALADAFAVLYDAQIDYLTKERAYALIRESGAGALGALHTLESAASDHPGHRFDDSHMPTAVIQALAEPLLRTM
ncbi:TIM-barrel domain-containing protein [Bifidobacterium sp. UTBIF-78]|uniref:glycoside hydrolase family 31 protein n=1 Tax=Bifidobacterium sp. UTBIF-78 TaxID=1465263 RepID=UPI001125F4A9|nr:TIM-barrel domain-containing protein [Bifidobacterium sp. UTBIF-78]TPF95076.1 alpha-glucosidase [Bifidobacterium sp. UTBIF-78]